MSSELRVQSENFSQANNSRSFLELLMATVGYLFSVWVLYVSFTNHLWIMYGPFCVIGGLFAVKLFALMHDCTHGSMFSLNALNTWVGRFLSLFITMPFSAWKIEHEIHHSHTGDMERIEHGDIPLLTVEQYQNMSTIKQIGYSLFRQPLVFFIITPFIYFFVKARFPSMLNKKVIASVLLTNIFVCAIYIPVLLYFGFVTMVFVFMPAAYFGGIIGMLLFYLQHNYPDALWSKTENWDYEQAALEGSSLMILPQPLEWFSHAIGYHHIHHLNSKIPGYRLRECYEEIEGFRSVSPLTWKDVREALSLRLWSYEQNKLIPFSKRSTVKS